MATLNNSYQFLGRSDVMYSTNGVISYYLLLYGKTSSNRDTGIHAVSVKAVLASTTNNGSYYLYQQEYNGKVGGTVAFSGTKNPCKAWELSNFVENGVTYKLGTVLGEGTINVDCANGLAKDITLSCYYKFKTSTAHYTPSANANRTVTVTVTLPAIARGATLLSAQNFNDGDNPTITYSNPAGTAVTSLQAAIYNLAGDKALVGYREISKTGTSYTFSLTSAERKALLDYCVSGNSIAVTFRLKTTIGSNTYYAIPIQKTFSIDNANPVITAAVKDINSKTIALTGNDGKLIKYCSTAHATMSAEAQKGAVLDENFYIIRSGAETMYGVVGTFQKAESNEFAFYCEDNRGNIGTETITLPMVDYIKLTCNLRNNNPDGEGNMTVECSGNYFNGSFGAVDNTLTVQYRYKTSSGVYGEWTDMSHTIGENNYFASATITGLDYRQTHTFEARAIDKLATVSSKEYKARSLPMFHWGENDFVFEVPVELKAGINGNFFDTTIDGDLKVTGDVRLKGDGTYGNTLRFGDGDYCFIAEPEDDVMTIYSRKQLNLLSNSVLINHTQLPVMDCDTWTPTLTSSAAVKSYESQYGWYSKIGQIVTIGFCIKATCNSGYSSTLVNISGLPFTPLYQASGGGMCSGAYISGGSNFQCYVLETTGLITTRTQSCNHTSAQNLTTSASGIWFPITGGTITLSATITYMTNS